MLPILKSNYSSFDCICFTMNSSYKQTLYLAQVRSQKKAGVNSPDSLLLCPLCWLPKSEAEMSFDHVVPLSIDGQIVILTCIQCNSHSGSNLDHQLSSDLDLVRKFRNGQAVNSQLEMNGHLLRGNLTINPVKPGFNFEILEKINDPKIIDKSREETKNSLPKDVKFSFPIPDIQMARLAVLKSCYLSMYRIAGYSWAILPVPQEVRKAVNNESLMETSSLILEVDSTCVDTPHTIIHGQVEGVNIIFFPVGEEIAVVRGAFLPYHEKTVDEFFENVALAKKWLSDPHNKLENFRVFDRETFKQPPISTKAARAKSRNRRRGNEE